MNCYTLRARQVFGVARQEAVRLEHPSIGPEHLLLGLLSLGEGVAVNALSRIRMSAQNALSELEQLVGRGAGTSDAMPLTEDVKNVVAYASEEAARLNQSYIGTEHLLLGMLHGSSDNLVVRLFKAHGIDIDIVRSEVLRELNQANGWPSTASANKGNHNHE